jgi:hypothetical protein
VTPLAIVLTGHGPRVPRLGRSEGTTFLLGIPPHATGSMTTTTSVTPSRPDATLRCTPTPLSDEVGVLSQIPLAPCIRGSDPGGSLLQVFSTANAHLQA